MTEATEKKQRRVVGRLVDGGLQILADVTPFVSSRLGPESVSRETEQEHDPEVSATDRILHSFNGVGQ